MTVYIDVLIVMNVYISYFILRAASVLLHTKTRFRRLAAASVLGGLFSLAALLDVGTAVSLLLKCAFTALTVLTAFGFGNVKLFALRSFVSISVSMLICGAAVLTRELTGSDFIFSANGYVYLNISALVLIISSAVIYGVLTLLRRILDSPVADERFSLTVRNLGVTAELTAIADTGNCLRDWLTGRPVIVCKPDAVRAVTPANVTAYLCGVTDDVAGIRLLPLNTVSGSGIAAAFRPDSVNVRLRGTEKRLDALIAVTEGALEGESFDAVIPAKLLQTI